MNENNQPDPIVEETHAIRREIAKRYGFDPQKISQAAAARQKMAGKPVWVPEATKTATTNAESPQLQPR